MSKKRVHVYTRSDQEVVIHQLPRRKPRRRSSRASALERIPQPLAAEPAEGPLLTPDPGRHPLAARFEIAAGVVGTLMAIAMTIVLFVTGLWLVALLLLGAIAGVCWLVSSD